jgi:hypothetical protein
MSHMKKKKGEVNRKRVLKDPAFEMTRQNNAEFSRAAKANGLLRRAFKLGLLNKQDQTVSGRLTQTMFNILQSDLVNDRGKRRVPQGVLNMLEGFNFNRDTTLRNALWAPYSIKFNKKAMQVTINFPTLISNAMIKTTSRANAFILTGMAASIHFEKETFPVSPVQTDILAISPLPHNNLQLKLQVTKSQPDDTIVVALGIEFVHAIGRTISQVEKKHNALAVVRVF